MAVNTLTQLPFSKVHVQDVVGRVDNRSNLDINELNKADDEINDRYDQSLLNNIDPDINFIDAIKNAKSRYYCAKQFNANYKRNNNLSFLHTNIRSIPRNFKDMNIYLEHLEHTFPIIGITESWLKPNNVNEYTPKGYNHEHDIRLSKNGGGVSMFISDKLYYTRRTDLKFDIASDINSLAIEIEKNTVGNNKAIVVILIYRPPSTLVSKFNIFLSAMINDIQKENKYVFFMGDFNINVSKQVRGSKDMQDFTNLLSSNSFLPLIDKPTRITGQSASLIDNIYTNCSLAGCDSGILCTDFSDHFPIFCFINNLPLNKSKYTLIKKRTYNAKNIARFNNSLINQNWDYVFNEPTAQGAFTAFQRLIDLHIERAFPLQTVKMNYKSKHPWMTAGLRSQIKERNTLSNMSKQQPANEELHKKYKKCRNTVISNLRNAEHNYYSEQLEITGTDLSKRWKVMKQILGIDNKKILNAQRFVVHGNELADRHDIAKAFNDYFTSIGSTLTSSISSNTNPLSYINVVGHTLYMPNVSNNDVISIVHSLKNSSPGWDGLPAFVAKQCVNGFITPLTKIINMCITQGVFPNEVKLARVVPVYKCNNKQTLSNYRPISILTFFSKVIETIMYNTIAKFLETKATIHDRQFGFRTNHSTQHAIITLVDKITKSVDSGDIVINLFVDLRKAFDTVSHSILVKKLYAYGIRGNILELCASYLKNRTQFVTYDGEKSETKHITCGVPQGSILGPLFFIAYMNDIFQASKYLYNILYADDTSILLSGSDLQKLVREMNRELELISEWFKANKLTLNIDKTYYMVFHRGRRKFKNNIELVINDMKIREAKSMKYLGVIIDSKLNWIDHITYIKNKVAKGIGIIRKAQKLLNKKALLNLYHTLIFPYLIYCVEIWGCAKKTHLSPLYLLQKRIVRIITFSDKMAHTNPIFKNLHVLPIDKLIHNRIGVFMYKIFYKLQPTIINNMYTQNLNVHTHNTRQKHHLHVSTGSSDFYTKSFYCSSILIWNDIMRNVDVSVSLFKFKKDLKLYLLNNNLKLGYTIM